MARLSFNVKLFGYYALDELTVNDLLHLSGFNA